MNTKRSYHIRAAAHSQHLLQCLFIHRDGQWQLMDAVLLVFCHLQQNTADNKGESVKRAHLDSHRPTHTGNVPL